MNIFLITASAEARTVGTVPRWALCLSKTPKTYIHLVIFVELLIQMVTKLIDLKMRRLQ